MLTASGSRVNRALFFFFWLFNLRVVRTAERAKVGNPQTWALGCVVLLLSEWSWAHLPPPGLLFLLKEMGNFTTVFTCDIRLVGRDVLCGTLQSSPGMMKTVLVVLILLAK